MGSDDIIQKITERIMERNNKRPAYPTSLTVVIGPEGSYTFNPKKARNIYSNEKKEGLEALFNPEEKDKKIKFV